jgi:hypothetical protein
MLAAMDKRDFLRPLMLVLLATAGTAAAWYPAPRDAREAMAAQWQAAGLRQVPSRGLDLLYVRNGLAAGTQAVQVAPVQVEMRKDWQRASRELEHVRLRPTEVQQIKDDVAKIVGDELRREFAGRSGAGAPVLEARVLDLYLNAPDIETATATKTYTRSFGDMVLVAELRDGRGGPLLMASWEHRPPREYPTPRLTTRVENATEVRIAAHAWARQLRRELDRLDAGG